MGGTPTHTGYGTKKSITAQSSSAQQPEQCRDKEKYWWWLVSPTPAACFAQFDRARGENR